MRSATPVNHCHIFGKFDASFASSMALSSKQCINKFNLLYSVQAHSDVGCWDRNCPNVASDQNNHR